MKENLTDIMTKKVIFFELIITMKIKKNMTAEEIDKYINQYVYIYIYVNQKLFKVILITLKIWQTYFATMVYKEQS